MTLVDELRQMVGASQIEYSIGSESYWSDTQIQRVLDSNRSLVDFEPIEWHPARIAGGSIEYKRATVNVGLALVAGTAGGTIQESTGDVVTGWTLSRDGWIDFSTDQGSTGLHFSGWAYDMNSAAAQMCDAWAAGVKGLVDVTSDDQSLKLSQKVQSLKSLARDFRAKAPMKQGMMTRGDAL